MLQVHVAPRKLVFGQLRSQDDALPLGARSNGPNALGGGTVPSLLIPLPAGLVVGWGYLLIRCRASALASTDIVGSSILPRVKSKASDIQQEKVQIIRSESSDCKLQPSSSLFRVPLARRLLGGRKRSAGSGRAVQ
jgi:hypothetical protein